MNGAKLLDNIKPSDLRRSHMQIYGIANKEFGIEYKLSSKEKSNQAIALYALSGKFQIYYVLDSFEAIKMNEKEIAIYPTQIKAYVDDSFDFRDQNHIFNEDGSIKELGQPVGAWDYNEVKFDRDVSESQLWHYFALQKDFIPDIIGLEYDEIPANKQNKIYPNYNHEYQLTQKHFNLGLDFFLYSSTFLDMDFSHTQMQDTAFIVGK
ncbi:hypothetical protein B6S12_08440 [Helicobacter valdiviensis]|uniref:Uncharacterized protein n=1 Tax=Helicobacter valdiviensis TaxID=1458358 RepID=A0A2W6MT38_9HELI|nr:DUF6402 family protein [Helicobacter valdiviensis]PZT47582.1 hypothetical protein B6S12_08440 [Helicobacter valdiviensis]